MLRQRGGAGPIYVIIYNEVHSFESCANKSVLYLKTEILKRTGIPLERQDLSFKGHILEDGKQVSPILRFSPAQCID